AGQRCTTTRRVIVHRSRYEELFESRSNAYNSLASKIGDPLEQGTLIGPLIDEQSFNGMQAALERIRGKAVAIVGGERVILNGNEKSFYVKPALVKLEKQETEIFEETFAPITYLIPYDTLEEAMEIHNAVPQGLSSAIMTTDL